MVTGIVLAVVGFVLLLIGLGLSVPIVEQFENPVPSAQQRGCPKGSTSAGCAPAAGSYGQAQTVQLPAPLR